MNRALTFLLIALTALLATSQTHYEGSFAVGAKGGITLSRMQFNPTVPQSFLQGYMVGGVVRYVEERNFGLIAEFNIEQRGWKENFEGYNYDYSRHITYVQVPLLTHVYFGNNKLHGFFNAGPEIGYLIATSTSANFDYNNIAGIADFPSANRSVEQMSMDVKNRLDYGISAGAGLELISHNKSSYTLEGRFYYGLRDIFGNRKKDVFSGSSGMSIMVTLGYMYRLK